MGLVFPLYPSTQHLHKQPVALQKTTANTHTSGKWVLLSSAMRIGSENEEQKVVCWFLCSGDPGVMTQLLILVWTPWREVFKPWEIKKSSFETLTEVGKMEYWGNLSPDLFFFPSWENLGRDSSKNWKIILCFFPRSTCPQNCPQSLLHQPRSGWDSDVGPSSTDVLASVSPPWLSSCLRWAFLGWKLQLLNMRLEKTKQ